MLELLDPGLKLLVVVNRGVLKSLQLRLEDRNVLLSHVQVDQEGSKRGGGKAKKETSTIGSRQQYLGVSHVHISWRHRTQQCVGVTRNYVHELWYERTAVPAPAEPVPRLLIPTP